jgi:hypothetical protein
MIYDSFGYKWVVSLPHTRPPSALVLVLLSVRVLVTDKRVQDPPDLSAVLALTSGSKVRRRDGHPVERASGAHGVRTHLSPTEPIPNLDPSGQMDEVPHAVDRVARRTPDRGTFSVLVAHGDGQILGEVDVGRGRAGETRDGAFDVLADRQRVRVDDLVVKHDTVERAVHAVVDVVCPSVPKAITQSTTANLDKRGTTTHT